MLWQSFLPGMWLDHWVTLQKKQNDWTPCLKWILHGTIYSQYNLFSLNLPWLLAGNYVWIFGSFMERRVSHSLTRLPEIGPWYCPQRSWCLQRVSEVPELELDCRYCRASQLPAGGSYQAGTFLPALLLNAWQKPQSAEWRSVHIRNPKAKITSEILWWPVVLGKLKFNFRSKLYYGI